MLVQYLWYIQSNIKQQTTVTDRDRAWGCIHYHYSICIVDEILYVWRMATPDSALRDVQYKYLLFEYYYR